MRDAWKTDMSTFFASFKDVRAARATVHELVRGGVRPDDVSLVAPSVTDESAGIQEMTEVSGRFGDATTLLGRPDDPDAPEFPPAGNDFTKYTTIEEGPIGGIDTSDSATNVDSIDQADDSQELADQMTYPRGDTSFSERQREDADLSMLTGFPTAVPVIDDVRDTTQLLDEDDLQALQLPGGGLVMGGGALATAALDLFAQKGCDALIAHLRDEGVPESQAQTYCAALEEGGALLAVTVTPGEIDEASVESIAERHCAENSALYDAPRYYRDGGRRAEHGGKNS